MASAMFMHKSQAMTARSARPAPCRQQAHISIRCLATPSPAPGSGTHPDWRQEAKAELQDAKDTVKHVAHEIRDAVEHKADQISAKAEALRAEHPLSQAEEDAAQPSGRHPTGHTGQIGVEYALRGVKDQEEKERVRKLQEAMATGQTPPPEASSMNEGVSAPPEGASNLTPAEVATFIKEG